MPTLDDFSKQHMQSNTGTGTLDSFGAAHFDANPKRELPAPVIPVDFPQAYDGQPVDFSPGFFGNVMRDVGNIGRRWWEGAGQAYGERVRSSEREGQALINYMTGKGTIDDYIAAREQEEKATRQFVRDTIGTPAMVGALVGVPGAGMIAGPIVARDIYDAAKERYGKEGVVGAVKQIAGDVTGIGPASEELPKLFTLDYWKQAYVEPITTVGGTAMALAPAALIGKAGYRGAKGALDKHITKTLDDLDFTQSRPTEGGSNSLYRAIVRKESSGDYNAVNPDSGARGNIQWMPDTWAAEAEKVLGDRNAPMTPQNQEVVGRAYIERLSNEFQNPELVAAAIYAGEGYARSLAKGKPLFDPNVRMNAEGRLDPNGKYPSVNEYIRDVMAKAGETGFAPDALSKRDYELTDLPEYNNLLSVLQNIGADKWDITELSINSRSPFDFTVVKSPEKRAAMGEGVILGEEPQAGKLVVPGTAPNERGMGAVADLWRQVEQDTKLGREKGDALAIAKEHARAGNYYHAARWAEVAGYPNLVQEYRNMWKREQGFTGDVSNAPTRTNADVRADIRQEAAQLAEQTRQQIASERNQARTGLLTVLEGGKQKAWDTAEADAVISRMNPEAIVLTEYFNTYKVAPEALERAVRKRYEKLVSEYTDILRGQMKQGVEKRTMSPVLDFAGNHTGDYTYQAGYSRNYKWYRDMIDANGGKFPNKAGLEYWLRETAIDHLKNGYRDPMYGELPPSMEFGRIEQAMSGLQKYRKQLPFEPRTWDKNKALDEKAFESGVDVGQLVDSAPPPPPGLEYMAASGMTVPKNSPRPATLSGAPVKDTVSRRDIVDKVNELFTKVSTGRLGVRGVLGWFDRNTEVVRTKDFADFRAIMHEIGHYLDKGLGLRKETAFDHELIDAVHRRFGNAYDNLTHERKRGEGIAEFIHDYTTNPARARQEFPDYYKAFEQRLAQEPQIKGKVEKVKEMLQTWYNQAAQERVKGSISFGDSRSTVQKVIDAAKDPAGTAKVAIENGRTAFEAGYDKLVDQLAPLDRMMKDIEKVTGQKIPLAQDVFKQAWLTRGWAGKAQALIENGMPTQGIPALKTVIKSVEKDMEGFSAYVVALRELDAYNIADKTGIEYKHALNRTDAAKTIAEGRKNPAFVKAQQDLVAFQNHLLDILVDAGIKDRASVEAMKAKWPNYAPFFREFDEAAVEKFFSTKGFGNVSDPVKGFKGSTRDIINPLESIIKNTYQFINLAERNKVGRLFVDLAQRPGLGKLIEKVTGSATTKDSTFSVWNNGRKEVYQTTPEMYRAVMLLDREPAQGIAKILSIPAGWMRAGAVLSPEFIVRNPVRDAWSAFIYSKYGFIPGVDTVRGLMHFIKKDDLYWEYMNSGAAHAAMVSLDRDYLSQSIREVMSKPAIEKAASVINPKTYIDILRAFSEATEMATRLGEYENARRGYNGVLNRLFSDNRNKASIEEAALGARDVTLDFSRSGVWGKEANKFIAFWNATVQGTDKMVRAFKDDPVGTSSKVFMSVTLPSIVLYYLNRDDPRYQELPQWQKDIFWIIPAKDTLIKIPKPFEVGILFGTSVERMLQWADNKAKGNQKSAFKGFGDTMISSMMPGWIPTAMLPIIEWTTNYSFFMDRDIVPQSQAKLPPKLQYGPNTSSVGKAVGEALNVSPSKVDNTIRGYTGGLGGLAMTASDLVTGAFDNRPSMRVSEYPGIRAFTATPYRSSQSVQDFYDRLQEQEQFYNEFKQTNVKPEGFKPSEYERLKTVERLMTQVHQQEKAILANAKMSSEEKRSRLDQLKVMAVNYARIGLGIKEQVK